MKDWKVGVEKGKCIPIGEDLFAEMCMRKNGVPGMEMFDITKDGCCEAKRPGMRERTRIGSQIDPPVTVLPFTPLKSQINIRFMENFWHAVKGWNAGGLYVIDARE